MIKVCPLFSGSKGNSTYIEINGNGVLLDAGVSFSRISQKLDAAGISPLQVKAILITHEHSDHIRGAGVAARKLGVPVYATIPTWYSMKKTLGKIEKNNILPVTPGKEEEICGICFKAFEIPHDASAPVGYNFFDGSKKFTVATDLGEMSEKLFLSLSGSDGIILESNHDVKMLLNGGYPYHLKMRIHGKLGHLSNDEAASVCARLASLGTKTILLGHLSEENNKPEIALAQTADMLCKDGVRLDEDVILRVLGQNHKTEIFEI